MLYFIGGIIALTILIVLVKKVNNPTTKIQGEDPNENLRMKVEALDIEEEALDLREEYAEQKHELNQREKIVTKKEDKLENWHVWWWSKRTTAR